MDRNVVLATQRAVTYSLALRSARDMELILFASYSNQAAFFAFRTLIAAQVLKRVVIDDGMEGMMECLRYEQYELRNDGGLVGSGR
jgi:hypothetical protein